MMDESTTADALAAACCAESSARRFDEWRATCASHVERTRPLWRTFAARQGIIESTDRRPRPEGLCWEEEISADLSTVSERLWTGRTASGQSTTLRVPAIPARSRQAWMQETPHCRCQQAARWSPPTSQPPGSRAPAGAHRPTPIESNRRLQPTPAASGREAANWPACRSLSCRLDLRARTPLRC